MDKTSTFGARLVAALLSAALLSACGDAPINVAPTVDAADARDASMPVDLPPAADRGGPDLGVPDSSVPDAGAPDAGGPDLSVPDSAIADLLSDDEPFVRQRAACAFSAGALPSQTFGPSIANAAIPIDTFVILIKENRSFDHYFSLLPSRGQPDAEVAPAGASNPDSMGNPVARYHAPSLCTSPGVGDLAHSWTQMHNDWNNGAMDGFVRVNGVPEPMSYYDDTDLPFLYGLASTFAIADHYFAPVLGPTGPNRYFLYAGSSDGIIDTRTTLSASHANLFDMLSTAGVRRT